MNKHHHRHHYHHNRNRSRKSCGDARISRLVRELSRRLGIHRHAVIAGFVLGFIFVPILTALVLLAAFYWVNHPERIEGHLERFADKAREAYRTHMKSSREERPEPNDSSVPDFPDLRRRFEDLEARAQAMETCVASDEFTLDRQFKNIQS